MEVKEGGLVIIKGDNIENGGLKIVKNYCYNRKNYLRDEPITEEELKRKVDLVRNKITSNRLWFPVCKYMMWHKIVNEGDFRAAVSKLEDLYPELNLNVKDMSSLNVMSFRKELSEWSEEDAPVRGTPYNKYYSIAEMMEAY